MASKVQVRRCRRNNTRVRGVVVLRLVGEGVESDPRVRLMAKGVQGHETRDCRGGNNFRGKKKSWKSPSNLGETEFLWNPGDNWLPEREIRRFSCLPTKMGLKIRTEGGGSTSKSSAKKTRAPKKRCQPHRTNNAWIPTRTGKKKRGRSLLRPDHFESCRSGRSEKREMATSQKKTPEN